MTNDFCNKKVGKIAKKYVENHISQINNNLAYTSLKFNNFLIIFD